MSWLARSIANSLRLDDDNEDDDAEASDRHDVVRNHTDNDDDDDKDDVIIKKPQKRNDVAESLDLEEVDLGDRDEINNNNNNNNDVDRDKINQGRGVKEDLSEFTETLTRQLWGVASFLAPPPPPPPPPPLPRPRSSNWLESSDRGRTEVVEMEGQFGQFPEFPQSFLEVGMPEEEEDGEDMLADAVGITEEALDFAENTAHHPETWLNFPLSEEEEFDDFEISDSQFKHVRAIEHLAPRLAALRRELCPAHMTEGYFWMVYFVLLHSRLDKHDVDLLSTPQLVKARTMWMHELQKQTKPESDWLGRHTFDSEESIYFPYENLDPTSYEDERPRYMPQMAYPLESTPSQVTSDSEPEKHPHESSEIQYIDKSASEEDPTSKTGSKSLIGPSYKVPVDEYDEHEDDWVDDISELEGYTGTELTLLNEDDVSFSDLEDDLDCKMPIESRVVTKD
ncbi:hypothetical protein ACH5RR_027137 [Cinchona calisaya]|uniref:BSD domain-containing protein n=1 Tax=Cinchona calisaya TaxID=153742 RepID=A0ABD2Z7W6_9GENT